MPATENPQDLLHTVNLVTQILCIAIVTVIVALRFSVRFYFKQGWVLEDYACFIAWILFMAYCAVGIVIGTHGGGYHQWDLTEAEAVPMKKYCYVATLLYAPMALTAKIAILLIMTRIFYVYRTKIMFIYIFMGLLCCYYVACWLATLIADSVISVVTDFVMLILPLPLTWSLQMPLGKKLRVIAMLSTGGFATGFSLYRAVVMAKDGSSPDQAIVFIRLILTGNAEGGVALICACLPALNILLSYVSNDSSIAQKYGSRRNKTSGFRMENIRSGTNKSSHSYSRGMTELKATDGGSDENVLITDATAVGSSATSSFRDLEGIRKTVDVSISHDGNHHDML